MALMFKLQKQAEEMIRTSGERVTSGRVEVLSMLLAEQRALTHHEIEERLRGKHKLNRVTLYRVLEWLNEKGFVHKLVSNDRVWRFRVNTHFSRSDQHAHFECLRCTSVICLDDIKTEYDGPLPAGYQFQEIELTVKGLCAACA
jgi:Fur family ferric uptake transcriptional regulator